LGESRVTETSLIESEDSGFGEVGEEGEVGSVAGDVFVEAVRR